MEKLVSAYKRALKEVNDLDNSILNSDEFVALRKKSEALSAKMQKMLDPIDKKRAKLIDREAILLSAAVEKNVYETKTFKVKFKESKEVNKKELFKVVESIKDFMELATVTQKSLLAYAKTKDEDEKKDLENCVEVISKKPIGVIIN